MKIICKNCGDEFIITKNEMEDIEEGWCQKPELCNECLRQDNPTSDEDYSEYFSDADSGL